MIDSKWLTPLGRLRIAGYFEGTTLLLLLLVAVPLKHQLGMPEMVSLVGPIHGFAFIAYIVLTLAVVFDGSWAKTEIFRTVTVSIVPFGTFLNDRMLKRRFEES